jgi:transposase
VPAGRDARRARRRYRPEDVEAARAAIEGSRTSLERIERELGISTATLARWKRRGRWRRPGHPDGRARPARYRIARGRPYAADLVEAVRVLAMGTELSHKTIAKRVGIAQATVSELVRRRNWARPPVRPGSPRSYASKRTAPVRAGGDRRGRPYAAETVAAARELFEQTRLPAAFIAARVQVGVDTVYRWKKAGGWTRPRDLPDPQGRYPTRRRRGRRPVSSPAGGT